MTETPVPEGWIANLEEFDGLVELGRGRGFVTTEEIAEVLTELENHTDRKAVRRIRPREQARSEQLSLFGEKPPVIDEILGLDISSMTPLEAITKLYELQQKVKE